MIHTVGPVYSTKEDRSEVLRAAYINSLEVASALGAQSVAFPLISAGAFAWPLEDAVHQAVTALRAAHTSVERVVVVAFGKQTARLLRDAVG